MQLLLSAKPGRKLLFTNHFCIDLNLAPKGVNRDSIHFILIQKKFLLVRFCKSFQSKSLHQLGTTFYHFNQFGIRQFRRTDLRHSHLPIRKAKTSATPPIGTLKILFNKLFYLLQKLLLLSSKNFSKRPEKMIEIIPGRLHIKTAEREHPLIPGKKSGKSKIIRPLLIEKRTERRSGSSRQPKCLTNRLRRKIEPSKKLLRRTQLGRQLLKHRFHQLIIESLDLRKMLPENLGDIADNIGQNRTANREFEIVLPLFPNSRNQLLLRSPNQIDRLIRRQRKCPSLRLMKPKTQIRKRMAKRTLCR